MRTRVVVGVVSLLAFAMTCCAPLVLFIQVWMQQNAGTFDRQRFEGVVDQVRELGLKPGESADLRLDDVYQPKSLRLRKANEELEEALAKEEIVKRAGDVWATMTADGKLKVVIETRDLGHAGEYGFAYSEALLAPTPPAWSRDVLRLDLPGDLYYSRRKINDHWWEVYNNDN